MHEAYVECALWSSTDDEGEPLDRSSADLSQEASDEMYRDCADFCQLVTEQYGIRTFDGWDSAQLGHDFWLTRNGHGAGFWDRYYGADDPRTENGRKLTEAAKTFGECDLYVGDNGEIYC